MFRMYDQYSSEIKFSELEEPEETWQLLDLIGEGTYGEVYSVKNKRTGELILFKFLLYAVSFYLKILHFITENKTCVRACVFKSM